MSVTITASANSTPPANTVIATDQVGSDHHQVFKLSLGASGTNDGLVRMGRQPSACSIPVTLPSDLGVAASPIVVTYTDGASVVNPVDTSNSAIRVTLVAGGGTGGTAIADRSTFTDGGTLFTPVGGLFNDGACPIASGSAGIARLTTRRALHSNLRDSSGNELGNAAGSPIFGSVVVTAQVSASVSGGSVALLAGANVIGAASVIQSTPAAIGNAWAMKLTDGVDVAAVTTASEQLVFVNNTASVIINSGSLIVTNQISASVSGGSVALLAGANVIGSASAIQSTPTGSANAWPVRLTDLVNNLSLDSASRITAAASAVVTNQVSASISGGSIAVLAGANVIGSASVIQSTPTGSANAWPVRLTDLVNNLTLDSASRVVAAVTNQISASVSGGSIALLAGANVIGTASVIQSTPNSTANAWPIKPVDANGNNAYSSCTVPLATAADNGRIWTAGCLVSVCSVNISASAAACTIVLAGVNGFQIRVLAAVYSTTGSQSIGWISSSAASALLMSPMGFADRGGMAHNLLPHGFLFTLGNGSALVLTTTSACLVAGNLTYSLLPV